MTDKLISMAVEYMLANFSKQTIKDMFNKADKKIKSDKKTSDKKTFDTKNYTKPMKAFVVNDVILPVAGDVAHTIGSITGVKNNLLGKALANMTFKSGNAYDRFGIDPTPFTKAIAAGRMARGNVGQDIGDTVANRLYTTADTLDRDQLEARNLKFQAEYKAPDHFWTNYSGAKRINTGAKRNEHKR